MKKLIIALVFFSIQINSQIYEEKRPCDCNHFSPLKSMIEAGFIPILFLSDVNNNNYEPWSTSVLCPTGKAPVVQSESEDELSFTQIEYDEWSCKYSAYNAFDGDQTTAWSEGAEGDGEGEILIVPVDIFREIKIWSGFGKSDILFLANNRPHEIKIYYFQTNEEPQAVQNGVEFKNIQLVETKNIVLEDKNEWQHLPNLHKTGNCNTVDAGFLGIEIISVFKGNKYADTCISEIRNVGD